MSSAEQVKKYAAANVGSVFNAGHFFTERDHRAKAGTELEDVLRPQYWVHVLGTLDVGNRINVIAEDFSFYCSLLVIDVQKSFGARVIVLHSTDLREAQGSEEMEAQQKYAVKWRAARKWSIVDDAGNVIEEDITTPEEAQKRLASRIRAMAA